MGPQREDVETGATPPHSIHRVLLTGFRPFGAHAVNPTETIAARLAGPHEVASGGETVHLLIDAEVLEVDEAGSRWVAEVRDLQRYAVVLQLGLAGRAEQARLETIAVNRLDQRIADNSGRQVSEGRIEANGPDQREVDFDALAVVSRVGDPWLRLSADAGAFVCNESLYHTLGASEAPLRRGFLHLPPEAVMSLDRQVELTRQVVAALALAPPRQERTSAGDASSAPVLQVGAAALFRPDGRLLAARRAPGTGSAGRWELPGGKLEAGEDAPVGIRRELDEELGLEVAELTPLVFHVEAGTPTLVLQVWGARRLADVAPGNAHDAVQWVDAASWQALDWLPADVALLPRLWAVAAAADLV